MEEIDGDVDIVTNLKQDIKEAKRLNIPGRYDVPELGVKNATFVEVLEAVKRYYENKLKRKTQ